jgi:four helix bundle suffix protein
MIQAARSGKQNIAEASSNPTSKKGELKLLGWARGSLQELLEDYEDFLRQRNLKLWSKDSAEARAVRSLAYRTDKSYETYRSYLAEPEQAANTMICLINQVNYLLDRQIATLKEKFLSEGGWTEQIFHERLARRNKTNKSYKSNKSYEPKA